MEKTVRTFSLTLKIAKLNALHKPRRIAGSIESTLAKDNTFKRECESRMNVGFFLG